MTRRTCLPGLTAGDGAELNCWRLLAAAVAAAVLWVIATWFISAHYYDRQAADATAMAVKEAEHQAESIGAGIERIHAVRQGTAITLSEDETVRRDAIRKSRSKDLNRFLAAAEEHLKLDALWVGDANGYGIAAQSADPRDSPIGIDYSDRIYFRQAKAGHVGYQYAVGRTTGRGGVFFSTPIMDRRPLCRLRSGQDQCFSAVRLGRPS